MTRSPGSNTHRVDPVRRQVRAAMSSRKLALIITFAVLSPATTGHASTPPIGLLDEAATASAVAIRVDPPEPPAPAACDNECIIRAVWPDQLEDRAVRIAFRESRLQAGVINRNRDATGLFQIMWSVHRKWLCPQLNICAQSQLLDGLTNARAAYALYLRDGGWGPWATS